MTDAEVALRYLRQRGAELQKLPRDQLRMRRGYTSAIATVTVFLEQEIELAASEPDTSDIPEAGPEWFAKAERKTPK